MKLTDAQFIESKRFQMGISAGSIVAAIWEDLSWRPIATSNISPWLIAYDAAMVLSHGKKT